MKSRQAARVVLPFDDTFATSCTVSATKPKSVHFRGVTDATQAPFFGYALVSHSNATHR